MKLHDATVFDASERISYIISFNIDLKSCTCTPTFLEHDIAF